VAVEVVEDEGAVAATPEEGGREGPLEGVCCGGFLARPAIMATGRPLMVTLVERELTNVLLQETEEGEVTEENGRKKQN